MTYTFTSRHDEDGNYLIDQQGNEVGCIYELSVMLKLLEIINSQKPRKLIQLVVKPDSYRVTTTVLAFRLIGLYDNGDVEEVGWNDAC